MVKKAVQKHRLFSIYIIKNLYIYIMKPIAVLTLLLFATFCSCKKDKTVSAPQNTQQTTDTSQNNNGGTSIPQRDYMFIPMKNVRWKVHCQGALVYDQTSGTYHYDTTYHIYTDVSSMEIDTVIDNQVYHKFVADVKRIYGTSLSEFYIYIYLREDTLAKKVYTFELTVPPTGSSSYSPTLQLLDFVQDQVHGLLWYNDIIRDSMLIDNVYVESWHGINGKTNQQCFMQAYGIGYQLCILSSSVRGNEGQVKSLDFIYKSDSLHFDFDIKPTWP
jgi:hypothetical protein